MGAQAIAAVVYASRFPGQVECVSFGSPRPGNAAFAAAFQERVSLRWRCKQGRDLVTKAPAGGGYVHVGTELVCGRGDPYPDVAIFMDLPDHDSIRYVEELDILSARGRQGCLPPELLAALLPERLSACVMNELYKVRDSPLRLGVSGTTRCV